MEHRYDRDNPIGFFDSGVGGLSVLKQAISLMPNENFVYFGDSKNAPYGTKTPKEVKELTFKAVDFLLNKRAKAIVIACNTATSAAVEALRDYYRDLPIVGIEPALKPAVEMKRNGKLVIMATTVTLSEAKFNNLVNEYGAEAEIVPLPCPGLVELIEHGIVEGEEVREFLNKKFGDFLKQDIAAVVLGCTHYPFIKKELKRIIGLETPIIDGSLGTAKQLRRMLLKYDIINDKNEPGIVDIYNSCEESSMQELSYKLLNL